MHFHFIIIIILVAIVKVVMRMKIIELLKYKDLPGKEKL